MKVSGNCKLSCVCISCVHSTFASSLCVWQVFKGEGRGGEGKGGLGTQELEGLPSGLLCQSIAPACLDISFLFCFQQSRQFLGSHLDDDRHSLYSNASSVSSFSGKESSSKSSAKVSARKRVQGKLVIYPLALEILRQKKHICESDTQLGSVRVIYCQISTAEGHVQQVSSET